MNIEQQRAIDGKVIKDKRNAMPADTIIASPKCLGIEFLSDLPLEVKKPYSLSNLTPWADLVIRGTMSNVETIERISNPLESLKYCDTAIPIVIPSQNIIFQKLSLLSRTFIQFIAVTFIYKDIVSGLGFFLKKIRNLWLLIALIFSSPVVKAEDLKTLISSFEQQYSIPQGLLYAIALVESQMNPYAINVEGRAIISRSKAAALEAIKHYRSLGVTNIDVGVMQVNYRWHGKEFANLEEMLDVNNNIEYAAKLLTSLYKEHGSWHKATRLYHSATPEHYKKYSKKIIMAWLKQ